VIREFHPTSHVHPPLDLSMTREERDSPASPNNSRLDSPVPREERAARASTNYSRLAFLAIGMIAGSTLTASFRQSREVGDLYWTSSQNFDTVMEATAALDRSVLAGILGSSGKNDPSESEYIPRPTNQEEADARKDANKNETMNIVLLYADDWTFQTLGMVNPAVLTPNIDQLAREGMLFRQNSVTTSICWQSRASLFTSLYVAVHRGTHIRSDDMFNKSVQWPQTLYPQLRSHGYHTGYVGKVSKTNIDFVDGYIASQVVEQDCKHATHNCYDCSTFLFSNIFSRITL
jgi:hypothetical protein